MSKPPVKLLYDDRIDELASEDTNFTEIDASDDLDPENTCFTVNKKGIRLDVLLTELTNYSRSRIQKMIRDGRVTVDDETRQVRYQPRLDQVIKVFPEDEVEMLLVPEDIPLDIIYQDSDIIVINKQRGLVVHPAAGHATGTLVHALLFHCPDIAAIAGTVRPGIVHRLDKDTTGLMVVAKNERAMLSLANQIKERQVERHYRALIWGHMKQDKGNINLPIGRHPNDRKKMAVTSNGRQASTDYSVMEQLGQWSMLELKLHTGRTHQIRVHLDHLGHPIVGDQLYGTRTNPFGLHAQALHACSLTLCHPTTSVRMNWLVEPPEDFMQVYVAMLRRMK